MQSILKKISLLLSLLIIGTVLFESNAQNPEIDSLENLLHQQSKIDTIRINLLNETAYKSYRTDINKTLKYAEEAGELADKLSFAKGKAESLRLIGIYYHLKSDYPKALDYYQKSLKICEEFVNNCGISRSCNNIGNIYYSQGDYTKALEYYQKSIKIKEVLGDKIGISKSYNNIGNIYKDQGDYSKTLEYYQKSLKICKELNDKSGISNGFNNIGIIYKYQGNYPKALEYYQKSLKTREELGNKKGISNSYNNIGIIYKTQGDYPKALEYYQKSLKIKEELGNKSGISSSYNNIGAIYNYQGDYPKALEYYQKSLKIREKLGDKIGISLSLNNIGILYKDLGNYHKALEYYQKSLKIKEELGNKRGISLCYYNIGIIYKAQGDYPKALEYYQKSLEISNETGDKSNEIKSYTEVGSLYLKQKKIQEAYSYSKKAYKMAEEIGEVNLLKESSEILAKSCEALGLYKEAHKYYVIFKTMNDSLYNEENVKKITGLEYQYKFEKEKQAIELEQQKKDAVQAEEVKQQKTIRNSLIVGVILMFMLVLVVSGSFLQKRKANEKLKELNATKNKFFSIIAHDLKSPFNSLLGLSDLLLENNKQYEEDEREAIIKSINDSSKSAFALLENLLTWAHSQIGRVVFMPEEINIKTLINEKILLFKETAGNKNIKLLNNTASNLFVYADKNMIDTIIRNLISNAIKFTSNGGEIIVNAHNITDENKQNFTKISVKDNGMGILPKIQAKLFKIEENTSSLGTERESGTGLGLILCKEFVEKHAGKIWVESEIGKGSLFCFTIPSN